MEHLLYTEQDILERVDEYTLYCFYLKYQVEIGHSHSLCPPSVRAHLGKSADSHPSFGVFERKYGKGSHEFLWKDQGLGIHGDIFDLVRLMFNLPRHEAMQLVVRQFILKEGSMEIPETILDRKVADPAEIFVKSKPFMNTNYAFWRRFNVNKEILTKFNTTNIGCYWLTQKQRKPAFPPGGVGYAYHVEDKYQLYFPSAADRRDRFRNDWTDRTLPGFAQLNRETDTCIIIKAYKDIMCLDSFGYTSTCPRGESVLLPPEYLAWLKKHYARLILLFDNDGKHKGAEYDLPMVFVPNLNGKDKDPSDFCDNHGPQATAEMLRSIIQSV